MLPDADVTTPDWLQDTKNETVAICREALTVWAVCKVVCQQIKANGGSAADDNDKASAIPMPAFQVGAASSSSARFMPSGPSNPSGVVSLGAPLRPQTPSSYSEAMRCLAPF